MSALPRPAIVVTGAGVVSAQGLGVEELWSAVCAGRSAAKASPVSPRGVPVPPRAGTIGEFRRLEDLVGARALRRLAPISRLTVAAAAQCARAAKLDGLPPGGLADSTAVILGTSFGASSYHFEYYEKLFRGGLKDASPLLFSESVMNAACGHASMHLRLRGPSLALVGGEEVGLSALIDAFDRLQLGEVDAAIAGGAEEYCDLVHAAVAAGGLVAAGGSTASDGVFFAEGAAMLCLEREAQARGRGVPVLARWSGGATGRSPSGPEGTAQAVERVVSEAMEQSGTDPGSIDVAVVPGGRGTLGGAIAEAAARGLGAGGGSAAFYSPHELLGEGFGYTSAAMALIAVLALATASLPPAARPGSTAGAGGRLERALVVCTSRRGSVAAAVLERAEAATRCP